jgi:predicted GNAT superfamily acetyltransferase
MLVSDDITVRDCTQLDEFRQCVAVQKTVWGFDDEDLIPVRMFVVARKVEGQVLGAFDPSGRMIGFCLAVPGLHGPAPYLHSHMLAVLPEHRRSGVGYRLKLAQRERALAHGIRLIEWTFDPLEWKNAAFNLNRLGAIARRYVVNLYGVSSSPLHRGLPTDRLIAEWWLDSPRVQARLSQGGESAGSAPDTAAANPAATERIIFPLDALEDPSSQQGETSRIAEVQSRLRAQFQDAFARGLVASGFNSQGTTGTYLLSRAEAR